MAEIDYFTREGALRLRNRILAHWARQGVPLPDVTIGQDKKGDYVVRSNMVNGYPV